MTIGLLSKSKNFTLRENATTGALEVSDQNTGMVNGLVAEVAGVFNGGATGAVGAAHTVAEGLKIGGSAALQKKQLTGQWGVPFINS